MIGKDLLVTLIVVWCLIYLLYLSYSKYLKSKIEYLKFMSIFLLIEVFRRILVYGRINIKVINFISVLQIFILFMSLISYIIFLLKNIT